MTWTSAIADADSTERAIILYPQKRGYKVYPTDRKDRCPRQGFNRESIGICYEGGLDSKGRPKDTRTEWQKHSLRVLILTLLKDYPECRVCGHRDLSPDRNENGEIEPEEWVKACPCFDAENNWKA